jgi:hypothetical protein
LTCLPKAKKAEEDISSRVARSQKIKNAKFGHKFFKKGPKPNNFFRANCFIKGLNLDDLAFKKANW